MRILWGRRTSINVQKVAWVLAELDLDHKLIEVGGHHKGTETAEYRAMNPTGRVPTLVDGNLAMWESNAICRYLVAAYGGPLASANQATQARADMWMEWFQGAIYGPFIQMFYQTVRLPEPDRSAEDLAASLRALEHGFALAEAELQKTPYLNGAGLSLADIPFGACLYRYFTIDLPRPNFPSISAYYDRLCARAAYRHAVMVDFSSLRPGG